MPCTLFPSPAAATLVEWQACSLPEPAGPACVSLQYLAPVPHPRLPPSDLRLPGRQVFLYKRAQIFVGDVYGAYGGKGLGAFWDVDQLTMFADYRCVRAAVTVC